MTCPLSILPIPKGIPTWGYPPVSFEPYCTRVSGCSSASRYPRQPSSFSGSRPHGPRPSRSREKRERVRLLVRLTADSVVTSRSIPRGLEGGGRSTGKPAEPTGTNRRGFAGIQRVKEKAAKGARTRSVFHESPAMTAGFFCPTPQQPGKRCFRCRNAWSIPAPCGRQAAGALTAAGDPPVFAPLSGSRKLPPGRN
jgi:hypothetical protein